MKFGSADIKIMNWEIFDTEGNLFITGKNIINGKKYIEINMIVKILIH